MNKLTLSLLLFTSLSFGLASCSDDDKDEKTVPIYRVEATTDIDLSKYGSLECTINSIKYDATIEGNKVTATPKEGGEVAYTIYHDPEMIGGGGGGVYMNMAKQPSMWTGKADQSTFENMMYYDALSAQKSGNGLPSVITGLKLEHQYSTLHFDTKNMPEDVKVEVSLEGYSDTFITPYKIKKGTYQCISPLAMVSTIWITIDGEKYVTGAISDVAKRQSRAILSDSNNLYTFEVEYHPEAEKDGEKLIINNVKVEKWVNQHLISQQ